MKDLPTGTVTFLFTDIEGSAKLAQQNPDTWEFQRERHHAILRSAIEAEGGYVFQIVGDAVCAAFDTAEDAVRAAIKSQEKLHAEDWGITPLKVRMGIHTGKAEIQNGGDYHGYLAMTRTQRLMDAGHGGQILLSLATEELIRDSLPHGVSLRDMGNKRLKGLNQPERIFQLLAPNLPADFPPLRTLDIYRHNLPVQMTSFIGREREIAEIKAALREHRLVTLTGSGGTGKTRLALQVAADLLDQFPNGVWFIELAPINDPELVPQTTFVAMGLAEQQDKSILQTLLEFLREKKVLLVLDNCEHLIEACAQLSKEALSHSSEVKILASSREALGVQGEMAWRVPSLALPNPKTIPDPRQLMQCEATRLFIERAALANPHFEADENNAAFIAQICRRLDGIPLAIELAAARIKALSVEQIAARLDDRFRLLTGGARTALPRQQTLRALIDWSYNLLSEKEKTLLRRLAVFAGGWTLEAAEAVCAGDDIETCEVFDLLANLVDKSLVITDEVAGEMRYRRLETIRQYAREKFFESEPVEKIRDRHYTWIAGWAEKIGPELRGKNQAARLKQVKAEMDNIRAALEWGFGTNQIEKNMQILSALGMFWDGSHPYQESRQWYEKGLDLREHLSKFTLARTLAESAWLANRQADLRTTAAYANESLALAEELGEKHLTAYAHRLLALACTGNAQYEDAERHAAISRSIYEALGEKQNAIKVDNDQAVFLALRGDVAGASRIIVEEQISQPEMMDNPYDQAYFRLLMGWLGVLSSEFEKAEKFLEDALLTLRQLEHVYFISHCIAGLAIAAMGSDDPVRAARLFGAAASMKEAAGVVFFLQTQEITDNFLEQTKSALGESTFQTAWAEGKAMTMEQALDYAMEKT